MRIIDASASFDECIDYSSAVWKTAKAARTCYKTEKVDETHESQESFIRKILKAGHESVIEHQNVSMRIICDRGISHEIVRHRLFSYSQESSRYCNYSKDKFGNEITYIWPSFLHPDLRDADKDTVWFHYPTWKNMNRYFTGTELDYYKWLYWNKSCWEAETNYNNMIRYGNAKPEEARDVLNNSTKTELVMTGNLRNWRHFCKLRTTSACHPQMIEIASLILKQLKSKLPVFFEDIY